MTTPSLRALISCGILLLFPFTIVAQVQHDVVPLKPWPAPLYWQPTKADSVRAAQADTSFNITIDATTPVNALVFVGMTPCRVVDTRNGLGFTGLFGPPSLLAARSEPSRFLTATTRRILGTNAGNLTMTRTANTASGSERRPSAPTPPALATRQPERMRGLLNSTGSFNTFIGYGVAPPLTSAQLNNATAIGANAIVAESNSVVLGDSSVRVGIGTSAPSEKLDVVGDIRLGNGRLSCVKDRGGAIIGGA